MLKTEYLNDKIETLKKEVKKFETSEIEHDREYALHMKRLIEAYKKERIESYSRPEVVIEEEDYIFDNFPRRGEFV